MAQRSVQGRVGTRGAFGLGSFLVIAALLAAACGSSAGTTLSTVGGPVSGQAGEAPAPAAMPSAAASATSRDALGSANDGTTFGGVKTDGGITALDTNGPLIVRTGQMDLQVADLEAAIRAAESAVTAVGGYVAGSDRSGDADRASASVTFRIPAARWSDALDALRKLGTKVIGEKTASQEVTTQVVDLGARLVNLRVTETAMQAIMEKATKIPDILAVQEQLTGIRQQIEELTAQKQSLENQAALATLTLTMTPPPAVAVTQVREGWDPAREVDQAAAALVGLVQGIAGAAIWLLIVWLPILLVAGLIALVAFIVLRRIRRSNLGAAALPPAAEA
jgi:hypothetical protein